MTRDVSSVRIWLGIAALTLVLAFLLSYRSIKQNETSDAWLDETQQTLSALVALDATIADLAFAPDAEGIRNAAAAASRRIDAVAVLMTDTSQQEQRLQLLREEIAAFAQSRLESAGDAAGGRVELAARQRVSNRVRELRTGELALLAERVSTSDASSGQLRSMLIAIAVGAGVLLAWVFGLVIRDEQKRREVEGILRRANEALDNRVTLRTAELHAALEREQQLRREAEVSNRLKDEFLLTVSHELRTPLNALLGWADMLRLGLLPEHRRDRAIASIYDNAKLQQQLVADLLDTGRILTGKLRIDPQPVDLGEIVDEAVKVVAPAAEAKRLTITADIDPDARAFFGDPQRLQQILWNLLSNAVKFTSAGIIAVKLSRADNQVRIVVSDTGAGISPEFLAHVFDRFRQEKTGITRPHGGLGLGLAIVRQLAELHGGTVKVQSEGDGRGATFTVELPVAARAAAADGGEEAGAAGAAATRAAGMPPLDGLRALVIDDDSSARELVMTILEQCGASVGSAASAREARTAISHSTYDVLIADIAMPDEDGYSLVRSLRAQGVRQPIAALTAQARDSDRARAMESGFDMHIPKPIEARALAHAVAALAAARADSRFS
jgi:signal transduction histidine kinase